MAVKTTIRTPMPIRMRAKQFAMFDAMKGLTEEIAAKEQQCYPKRELTEERIEEINQDIAKLNKGDIVSISYYSQHTKQNHQLTDIVIKVDPLKKNIQIGDTSVRFFEIERITILSKKDEIS